jgi:predicted porin
MKFLAKHPSTAALAAFASFSACAQSGVTIYGIASEELVHVTGVSSGGKVGSVNKLDNSQVTTSRLGFRGVEDIGGGVSAIFGMESQIALDTGSQANASKFFNRGSYVGISSTAWGTVTAGRLWGINDDIMGRYFNFGGYSVFRFTEFGNISTQEDNAVKYVSPVFGGLQIRAMVTAGEAIKGSAGNAAQIGANYKLGDFEIGATHRQGKGANGLSDKLSTVGASYTFNSSWRLRGGVSTADPAASALPKVRAYALGGIWSPNGFPVSFAFDYVGRDQRSSRNDSHFWRLGADYFLSKRTAIFVTLVALENKGAAKERFYGDGAAGVNQNVSSLGLRHLF